MLRWLQKISDEAKDLFWRRVANGVWLTIAVVLAIRMAAAPFHRTVLKAYEDGCDAWWADRFYYEHNLAYLYPPTFSVAYSVFGVLPESLAAPLWALCGLAVAWLGIKAFLRDVVPAALSSRQESAVLILSLIGMFRGMWSAQANALVIGFALLALAAVVRRQWWKAAGLLALPIYIKLWPAALAMLLVPLRWRQLTGRFAVACLALAAIPWLTRPWPIVWRQHAGYFDMLINRRVNVRFEGYRDVFTIWEQFQTPDPHLFQLLQVAAGAAVFGACLWLAWRQTPERTLWTGMLGMWLSWQLLLGPGTERLTFGVIAPLMSWAIAESWRTKRLRALSLAAFTTFYLLGSGEFERRLRPYFPWSPTLAPLGCLLYVTWLGCFLGARSNELESARVEPTQRPIAVPALEARAVYG